MSCCPIRQLVALCVLLCLTPVSVAMDEGAISVMHAQAKSGKLFNANETLVAELHPQFFDQVVASAEHVVIKFYAPWCKMCKILAPEVRAVAAKLIVMDFNVTVRKLNADLWKDTARQYGVSAFPTFHYFRNGTHKAAFTPKFQSAQGLTDQFLSYLSEDESKKRELVLFESGSEDLIESFVTETKEGQFALVMRGYKLSKKVFAYKAAVKDIILRYSVSTIRCAFVNASKSETASLKMYRPGFGLPDHRDVVFNGQWDAKPIGQWAKARTYPTVGKGFHIDKYGWSAMSEISMEAAVVGVVADNSSGALCSTEKTETCTGGGMDSDSFKIVEEAPPVSQQPEAGSKEHLTEQFIGLAAKHPSWRFTVAEAGDISTHELQTLGWQSDFKAMVTVLKGKRKKYVLHGAELEQPHSLQGFLSRVNLGQLTPNWKSEPITAGAAPDVDNGLTVLKGGNFEEFAFDPSQDVMVFFHAPWCAVCNETVGPLLGELAERIVQQGWEGVRLAKFDASQNECEEEVPEFPKVVVYPAVERHRAMGERRIYPGIFNLDHYTEFLVKYSKNIKLSHWIEKPKPIPKKPPKPKEVKKAPKAEERRRRTDD